MKGSLTLKKAWSLVVLVIALFTTQLFMSSVYASDLNYGIRWFGQGNVSQKAVAGQSNPYYNPNKPTVIYAHGWQNGAIVRGTRETFNYKSNDSKYGLDINSADAWINAGWNIGILEMLRQKFGLVMDQEACVLDGVMVHTQRMDL